MSSGESAITSMFARLMHAVRKKSDKKAIVILMDEAELSLHPHWQVCFLKTLLQFIEKEFKRFKVQLILTSHSPFIVSDLPNNCIVMLKRDDDGVRVQEHLNSGHETFGANIHRLFTDKFFMKDSLMGAFAREKIDMLIKEIFAIQTQLSTPDYDRLNGLVNIVGEPFIRARLKEQLIEFAPLTELEKLIASKEQELDDLKRRQHDQDQ